MHRLRELSFVCTLLILSQISIARPQYSLLLDASLSPRSGAFSLCTLHRAVYGLEGQLFKTRWSAEDRSGKKILGVLYRFSKTALLDNVLDHLAFLVQHEFFGHGARFREFGYSGSTYSLHLIFPYGDSRGWAFRGTPDPNRMTTDDENLLMIIGGFDASACLSQTILFNWVQRGTIHYRESLVYLFSATDLSSYILRTKYHLRKEAGNDVLNFLRAVNPGVGIPEERHDQLTIDDLACRTLISAVNPFLYFSLATYIYRYLWAGQESMTLPMIPIGGVKVLPLFRFGLAPFGTEFYFENFATFSDKAACFYLRYSPPDFHKSWGAGLNVANLFRSRRFSVQARSDVWSQPSIKLGGEAVEKTRLGLGGAIFGTIFYKLMDTPLKLGIAAQIGYKTSGYLEGEMLRQGLIIRAGLGFME